MKTLVVYYSKTGHTRKIGNKIAKILKADVEEVVDKTDRSGIMGWIFGGRDAMRAMDTEISFKKDPSKYDVAIIGTPVWAWTVTPAIRRYLKENKIKKVAFFCTYGGAPSKTFSEMESLSKKPIAVLGIKDKEIDLHDAEIKEFCRRIK